MLRPIRGIKKGRTFTESLIADFVEFSSAIAKVLFLGLRLGTRLYRPSLFRFFKISSFSKMLSLDNKS